MDRRQQQSENGSEKNGPQLESQELTLVLHPAYTSTGVPDPLDPLQVHPTLEVFMLCQVRRPRTNRIGFPVVLGEKEFATCCNMLHDFYDRFLSRIWSTFCNIQCSRLITNTAFRYR